MLRSCFAVAAVATSLLSTRVVHAEDELPRVLRAEEGLNPPVGYVGDTRLFRGLWLAGTIGGGASYAATVMASGAFYGFSGLFSQPQDDVFLLGMIPIMGPFRVAVENDVDTATTVMFATLGAVQVTSICLLIVGLSTNQRVWVLDERAPASATVGLSPMGVRVDY